MNEKLTSNIEETRTEMILYEKHTFTHSKRSRLLIWDWTAQITQ